jgi:YggT family protein
VVAVGIVIELFLWFYILFVLARLVADWVQMFARSWAPRGPVLVLMEIIYTATDPPIRLFRRFIPPLRLGGASLDLSVIFVLLICYVLSFVNRQYILVG